MTPPRRKLRDALERVDAVWEAKLLLFRGLLVAIFVALWAYTAMVLEDHGWNLPAVFFGDMR